MIIIIIIIIIIIVTNKTANSSLTRGYDNRQTTKYSLLYYKIKIINKF
jgi:hypothetical protein